MATTGCVDRAHIEAVCLPILPVPRGAPGALTTDIDADRLFVLWVYGSSFLRRRLPPSVLVLLRPDYRPGSDHGRREGVLKRWCVRGSASYAASAHDARPRSCRPIRLRPVRSPAPTRGTRR